MEKPDLLLLENLCIARRTEDGRVQPLSAHEKNVAHWARMFAQTFGLGNLAETAGKLHDAGKMTPAFQSYIRDPEGKRGSVQHSIYGAKLLYDSLSRTCLPAAELLANCVASHHGGLRDYLAPDGETPLIEELSTPLKNIPNVSDAAANAEALFTEIKSILAAAPDQAFALSMLTKLLYSCLVDADRLDAYLFESGGAYTPQTPDWDGMRVRLEKSLAEKAVRAPKSEMTALRESVSVQCAEAGLRAPGVYQLSVPTGGGKTLSSLRFALRHVLTHKMDRIIYVIPYLSILEQTADAVRGAIGAGDETVLEHHSNILPDNPAYYKLRTDRWDAPIILTTQVQFLESVFSSRGGDLRKLHNMANSVIIFDEVQSLPVKCVHLFNAAVNFLQRVCGSTILLCTATQPLLDRVERPILLSDNPSLAECGAEPRRTKIVNVLRQAGYTIPALAEFVLERGGGSTLVIVNTKGAAKALAVELKNRGTAPLHLSTNMCPAHRETVFAEIKRRLDTRDPVICVSTQLIEAGVDISFECVVRNIAGVDSIFQAAGRCNRGGEFGEIKNVYVVNIKGENLDRLPDIKIGAEITRRLFDECAPGGVPGIEEYYRHYFYARRNCMDYPTADDGSIYDLLAANRQGFNAFCNGGYTRRPEMRSAIRSAEEKFYVIAPGQTDVVVLYSNGQDEGGSAALLDELTATDDIDAKRRLLRKLGRYSVSLYKFQMDALNKSGAFKEEAVERGLWVLDSGFYDPEFGVNLDGHPEFLCI